MGSEWSTLDRSAGTTIPENRACAMNASSTDALWIGYLHPQHSDAQLESDLESFLRKNLPEEHHDKWQFAIVRGKYTQAKVRLQKEVSKELVQSLNERTFVEAGVERTITVDDAHGSPGQKCPRMVAQ